MEGVRKKIVGRLRKENLGEYVIIDMKEGEATVIQNRDVLIRRCDFDTLLEKFFGLSEEDLERLEKFWSVNWKKKGGRDGRRSIERD